MAFIHPDIDFFCQISMMFVTSTGNQNHPFQLVEKCEEIQDGEALEDERKARHEKLAAAKVCDLVASVFPQKSQHLDRFADRHAQPPKNRCHLKVVLPAIHSSLIFSVSFATVAGPWPPEIHDGERLYDSC